MGTRRWNRSRTARRWFVAVIAVVALGAVGCQPLQWAAAPQGGVVSNADGRLEFFSGAIGRAGVSHTWQVVPNDGWASGPMPSLPFSALPIETARNADGRLEAFASGGNELWHTWQDGSADGWAPWAPMGVGSYVPDFDVALNADGRLEVFAVQQFANTGFGYTKERVAHSWQLSPGSSWSGWAALGEDRGAGTTGDLAAARNADGRLEVFATGGGPRHAWQLTPGGAWSGWVGLPMAGVGRLAVAPNADGRLEVFGNDGNRILHAWQVVPNGGWSGGTLVALPVPTAPFASPLAAAPNADGRLEVFFTIGGAAGVPGQRVPGHVWQRSPNGATGWSPAVGYPPIPFAYGGLPAVAGVGANADGRLELFVGLLAPSGTSSFTVRTWQTSPNGGWSGWVTAL
jgi:hypothetical protein